VPASAVLGCGRHLPARTVTDEELARDLGASGARLAELTGVTRRHHADDGHGPSDLAREAALAALASAGLGPADVDLIVFATMTPDIAFPGSGCFLQEKLGCRTVGALDVRAQCAGALFALATADRFVRAGAAERVLVACAEVHSTALEYAPRAAAVTPYFGDGAGALVLGAAREPGVLAAVLHSDPDRLERFWCEFPASRHYPARMDREAYRAGRHYYQLDAAAVHPQAREALVAVTREVLARAGVPGGSRSHRGGRYPDRARRRARRRAGGEGRPRVLRGLRRGHVVGRGAPAPVSGGTMDETVNSRILGLGHHLPERVVTNQDLTRLMDTSEEWIEQRTGIRERRFISADMGGADLGERAAREALREAGIAAGDLDLVILGSLSPDIDFPGTASLLQRKLGVRGMPVMDVRNQCSGFVYMLAVADAWIRSGDAMDVRNQCSGFVYMLAVADAWIRSGDARYVLVVGAEIHSTGLDLSTLGREVAVIFGDGAGAAVLGPEPDRRRGILSTHLHSEGRYAEKLMVEAASSRVRPRVTEEMLDQPGSRLWPRMEGRYVFKHAVTRFPEVIREALAHNGCTTADLDLLIPHQANLRISQLVAMGLELPEEKVFNNIQRYGNTTAASIPIALHEAVQEGRVRPGALVCLAAFGAGFTWGAALMRW